jgi:hypothetical protein
MRYEKGRYGKSVSDRKQAFWQGMNCGYPFQLHAEWKWDHLNWGLEIQHLLDSDADHSPPFSVKVNTATGFMDFT